MSTETVEVSAPTNSNSSNNNIDIEEASVEIGYTAGSSSEADANGEKAAGSISTAEGKNPNKNNFVRKQSIRGDPFAAREGKTLTWRKINMTLAANGKHPEKKLLDDVWGEVPKKEITAIMGPSGAGKTSLLNILAGRVQSTRKISVQTDIRFNNYLVDPTHMEVRKQIAFVAQDDSLQVTSTPREAIRFSAKLRLPRSTTEDELDILTERMLQELGLVECANTIVGGALIKGISGGERKRTSVGVELVTKPALVFLDEPTSGLDSFSAVQLVQVLKKVANAGSSVLFTIHQPASEVFNSFDHLILLNRGRVMYQGSVSEVPDFFAERGQPLPPNYNPADWIMSVAQVADAKELEEAGFCPKDDRDDVDALSGDEKDVLAFSRHSRKGTANSHDDDDDTMDERQVSIFTETRMLYTREINNLRRDVAALGARFGVTIVMSLLVGIIFFDVGSTWNGKQLNINSHFGALIMVLLMGMFGTAQPALLSFPEERPVFLREYSTNHYSVMSYFVSRLSIEMTVTFAQVMVQATLSYLMIDLQMQFIHFVLLCYTLAMASTAIAVMLGCSVEDPKLAQEMLPLLFVPQMLFAGFFVAVELIPEFLSWARYLCSLTYAIRLALYYEFDDCAQGDPEDNATGNCQMLLHNVGVDPDDIWWYWVVLAGLFIFFRVCALIILRQSATKYL